MTDILGAASAAITVVEFSAAVAIRCLKYIHAVRMAEKEAKDLEKEVKQTQGLLEKANMYCRQNLHGNDESTFEDIRASAEDCGNDLKAICKKLEAHATSGLAFKLKLNALKWPFERNEIQKLILSLNSHTKKLALAVSITTGNRLEHSIARQDELLTTVRRSIVHQMPIAENAAYNSFSDQYRSKCHGGTRLEIRAAIRAWVEDPASKRILWLNGMAGTGKSTISRTVAEECDTRNQLGASFFFQRGEKDRGDASRLISTLSAQLTEHLPEMLVYVQDVLTTEPTICNKNLFDQFHRLVLEPLKKITFNDYHRLVFVIDALDECENEDQAGMLLCLFSEMDALSNVRIFLTSRPESFIRRGFQETRKAIYRELLLQEISMTSLEHDLEIYLRDELRKIRTTRKSLASDWPGEPRFQALLKMAIPLFIFAATMCRFIADTRIASPNDQLDTILEYQGIDQTDQLDLTYRPVLDALVRGLTENSPSRKKVISKFKGVIGIIIVLAEPLTVAGIAGILGKSEQDVEQTLDYLHSVLSIPKDRNQPVRPLHKSFRDYMLDEARRDGNAFWIDEKAMHADTAGSCLRLLSSSSCMKKGICSLLNPDARVSDIDPEQLSKHLPMGVQYACRYWAHHLVRGEQPIRDGDYVHDFLREKFLYWIEALCWLGRGYESIETLSLLRGLIAPDSIAVSAFITDAQRFIGFCVDIVHLYPLQLYASALTFAPQSSILKITFKYLLPRWVVTAPKTQEAWDPCIRTLTGHTGKVLVLTFSHDGTQLASGCSNGLINLWNVTTGALEYSPTAHDYAIRLLMYADEIMASVSADVIRVWNSSKGQLLHQLQPSVKESITEANLSVKHIAACTTTPELLIWGTKSGELMHSISLIARPFKLLFHDSLVIAAGSDSCVRIWDAASGELCRTLDTGQSLVNDIVLSSRRLLSCSDSVKLWSIDTGCMLYCSQSMTEPIWQISYANQSLITVSERTIHIRDPITFDIKRTIDKNPGGKAQVYSERLIAITEMDGHIRLLASDSTRVRHLVDYSDWTLCLSFSSNGRQLASGSSDSSIKLWDISQIERLPDAIPKSWTITLLHISPHGRYAIMALADSSGLGFWEAAAQVARLQNIQEHRSQIIAVAFSDKEDQIATADEDGVLVTWNPLSKVTERVIAPEGSDPAVALEYSIGGNLIGSGHYQGSIKIWDAQSGRLLRSLEAHTTSILYLRFSSNSYGLVSMSVDGKTHSWTATSSEDFSQIAVSHSLDFNEIFDKTTQDQFGRRGKIPRQSRGRRRITLDNEWLTYQGRRLMWIPHACRPKACEFDSLNGLTAISGSTGQFMLLRFDLRLLDDLFTCIEVN